MKKDNLKTDEQNQLWHMLFMQNIAATRNVTLGTRYKALADDIALMSEGEEPFHCKAIVEKTRLPDRC